MGQKSFHLATPFFSFSILDSRSFLRSSSPMRARTLVHCFGLPRMSWSLKQSCSQSFLMISTARFMLGWTLSFLKRTFLVLCSPPDTTYHLRWENSMTVEGKKLPEDTQPLPPSADRSASLLTDHLPSYLSFSRQNVFSTFTELWCWKMSLRNNWAHPAMHPSPATVDPQQMLKAKILSKTSVQYLHRNHHVPSNHLYSPRAQEWKS